MRLTALFVATLVFATLALAAGTGRIISSHGVRVVVPSGWQRAQAASAAPVTDPSTLVVVGTAGVRPRHRSARSPRTDFLRELRSW
ncbi:MAG: hypothetical protein H0U03_12065 [Actinobacteria bacterium]|nr:hypothetical protein [Actinomycetota bacterium]